MAGPLPTVELGLPSGGGEWRRPSLVPVIQLTAIVGVLRIIIGLATNARLDLSFAGVADMCFVGILVAFCFVRTTDIVRFVAIEVTFLSAAVNVVFVYGMSPGAAVLLSLFVLVATMAYDMKVGVLAGLACLLLVLFGGWGWTSGFLPLGGVIPQVQPTHFKFWVYSVITIAMAACSLAWIVASIMKETRAVISQLHLVEEKFSKAFRMSPDAMIISEFESGTLLEVNDSHEQLTGYRREDVIGRTSLEIGTFKDAADRQEFLAPMQATGSARRVERKICDRSGREIDVLYSSECFVLAGKKCLVTIMQDITERKRAEAALIANEERFRSFIENASVGIYRSTPDGNIVMANPALIRIMGYDSLNQLARRNLEKDGYEPSYSRGEFKTVIESTGRVEGLEVAWRKKDGSTIFVRESAVAIRDAAGTIQFYDGIIEDVSERKRAEQELRESEERFRNLNAAAFEGIVISENGRLIDVNDQALKLFGYEREEMIGRNVIDFVSPETRALVSEAIRNRTEDSYRHQLVRKDGSCFEAEAHARMMRLGDRNLRVTALRDLTESLQAAQRERVLEEQVRQMQKMEALGALAGGIAHDFNNILTGIMSNLQLAEIDLPETHPAYAAMKSANQASIRARDLVARILSFSRLEHDNRAPAPLGPVVLEALQLLRVGLPGNVEIRTDLDGDCPPIAFDPGQIHQVVMNLGTNGIHALRDAGGVLTVELCSVQPGDELRARYPQVESTHTVCLRICDNGCGMEAEVLNRIFEPFFTTKAFGQGTGLGLSVVHAIMKNHKGAIVVESSPGSGTSFSLYFPAAGVDVARPKEGKRRIPGAALAPFGQGRKIMLVDDEDAVRSIGSKLLGRLGFVPEVYERPVEALNAFRAASCDYCALISDLTMPEMTGLELAKQILAIRPGLPVILTSGHFQAEVRQEAIDSGVQSLVNKPFEIQELVSRIRLVLNEPVSEVA